MGRKTKQDKLLLQMLIIAVVAGLPLWLFIKAVNSVGLITVVMLGLGVTSAVVFIRFKQRAARRTQLLAKYGDQTTVERIMKNLYWQGQTQEQLLDSLGHPLSIDNHLLKTKERQTWKYQRTGKNRYSLRFTLEDRIVVGWIDRT